MKSVLSLVAASLLFGASTVSALGPSAPGPVQYKGCYSSSTGLSLNSTYTFNTQGYCQKQCAPLSYTVLATKASTDCWCGNEIPPTSDLVDDSFCDAPCAGYGQDKCGSFNNYWSVWLSGVATVANTAAADSSTAAPTATEGSGTKTLSSTASVVTLSGQTIVVTAAAGNNAPATASASAKPESKGPNKAGIAAGVVVGVVAIAAIAGGIFLFLRHKKRREVEEEYRRNAAVNNFVGKPPNSSGGDSAFTDTRLDAAAMAQRRMSDGSIADNQDYSRRILKVTNA